MMSRPHNDHMLMLTSNISTRVVALVCCRKILDTQIDHPVTVIYKQFIITVAEHVKKLQKVYVQLTERMTARCVADEMFQRLALTAREHDDIQSSRTEHTAAGKLIQILLKASREVYQSFLAALKLSNQKHIYQLIECAGIKFIVTVMLWFQISLQSWLWSWKYNILYFYEWIKLWSQCFRMRLICPVVARPVLLL